MLLSLPPSSLALAREAVLGAVDLIDELFAHIPLRDLVETTLKVSRAFRVASQRRISALWPTLIPLLLPPFTMDFRVKDRPCSALRYLVSKTHLRFDLENLADHMAVFARACRTSGAFPHLNELSCIGCSMGPEAAGAFALALPFWPRLSYLNLDKNAIGDAGLQHIGRALADRVGRALLLLVVVLSNNQIEDAGVRAFAAALGGGALPRLASLDLGANRIGDAGMGALAAALNAGAAQSLVILKVSGNRANPLGAAQGELSAACVTRGLLVE